MKLYKSLWKNRELLLTLTKREIEGPYRGGVLGLGWTIANPILMLLIYTFIFSQVFHARWGDSAIENSPWSFALNMFGGLIAFNLFSECARKSPKLISENPNYVKKIIFPLELLGASIVGAACYQAAISALVLICFKLVATNSLSTSILWLPFVWLPLVFSVLTITWILSAIGVFVRDIDQSINIGLNLLMFITPIFYPLNSLPHKWQSIIKLNPLSFIVDQTKRVTIQGDSPDVYAVLVAIFTSMLACEVTLRFFMNSRKVIADEI